MSCTRGTVTWCCFGVDAREAEQMLIEVHEGSFGTHANGHAMA